MISTERAPTEPSRRSNWVDRARGLGIFLVVVGHVERGVISAGIAPSAEWLNQMDAWIYAFHMPLFFWLSGLFAIPRCSDPWPRFFSSRARTILYPYALWSALQLMVQIGMSRSTNTSAGLADLLRIPFDPPAQFWFLYALFLVSAAHCLLQRLLRSPWAVLGASVMLYFFSFLVLSQQVWFPLRSALEHLPYYALGALSARHVHSPVRARGPQLALGILCYLLVGAACAAIEASIYTRPLIAVIGITGTALISRASSSSRLRFLDVWGQASLQIYVAHVIAGAGFRILLIKIGVTDVGVHLVGGVAAGIAFPLALDWGANRIGFKHLFTLKKSR